MAFNPYIGRNQSWLEEQLRQAQDELASGKSAISGQMGEVQFGNTMTIGPAERIRMILRALNRLDPTTYPIDQISPVTRTVAAISSVV